MIGICCDSGAQLPSALAAEHGIEVAPLTVTVDGVDHLEGLDLDADAFWAHFTDGHVPELATAAPSPGRIAEHHQRLVDRGATSIVSVHTGAEISGTSNAARLAAERRSVPMELVDTGSASFVVGCAALAAAEAVAAGAAGADAAAAARAVAARCGNVFIVGGLDLARAGGRLADDRERDGPPAAVPVLRLAGGEMTQIGDAESTDGAAEVMAAEILSSGDCVPSKTLLAAAERGASFDEAMAAVHYNIERIAAAEDTATLRNEGIEVMAGHARLTGPGGAEVDGERITARRIVLATGARPAIPDIPGLHEIGPLTSETVFSLDQLPRRFTVLGGGAIGVEMAQAFAALGSAVTIIEAEPRLLPREEPEASDLIAHVLAGRGVDLRLGRRLERAEPTATGTCVRLDDGALIDADHVLVAVGRTPTTDGLGLDAAGVDTDERGHIHTDDTLATTAAGIWAIGDVNGRMPFTHAAARMAFVATQNALSPWSRVSKSRFDTSPIPWVTFTSPEIARVGMTEDEAALAVRTGMFTGRLAQTTHAYPTWSSAVQQAAAQFFMTVDGRTARSARRHE